MSEALRPAPAALRLMPAALLAAALGLACACAQAQSPSPAKKALVDKVLSLQQQAIENVATGVLMQPAQQLIQVARVQLSKMPEDKRELLANEIQAEVRKFVDDNAPALRSAAVKAAPSTLGSALEAGLSEDELKQLVAWMENPLSKKVPQLLNEGQQAMLRKLVTDAKPTIEPRLKTLEASVAKKLGLPAPGASAPAAAAKPKK